jgi:hypothetical protein
VISLESVRQDGETWNVMSGIGVCNLGDRLWREIVCFDAAVLPMADLVWSLVVRYEGSIETVE